MQFATPYQEFIYLRTYSRWLEEMGRRERWDETVNRYFQFMAQQVGEGREYPVSALTEFYAARTHVLNFGVMPSMRALWTAGPALENDNIAGYNCAYTAINRVKAFAEILYILMNGAGVGFSTERQYIAELPTVAEALVFPAQKGIVVEDSKLGWAEAYLELLEQLWKGIENPLYDTSKVRPKGARLKTFGGRASGPQPLIDLFEFTKETLNNARGRKLTSIECYDIVCKIAACVVVGGVRRSATINLSNLSDQRMRHAKDGNFWITHPDRALSNNSVAYTEKPDMRIFMEEWVALMQNGNGERGIVNRKALQANPNRTPRDFGVNPCGEIALRPNQFCNLTEVVVRPEDTLDDLQAKVRSAVILGCLQSTLTNFKFLAPIWKENCEEERLLGVSLTGVCDHPILGKMTDSRRWLKVMKEEAIQTAFRWSKMLGINMPVAITCVKPSGTVSQLVNTASGLHPRHSKHYIRRVRVNRKDPLCQLLLDQGVPANPEVGQTWEDCSTVVFDFPVKSESDGVYRGERTAVEQLEFWKLYKECWTDHNPSVTIYVKDDEWLEVGAWVYKNWDYIGGLSFFPHDGSKYPLAPYEEVDAETFAQIDASFPVIDFSQLSYYEFMDNTTGAKEYACAGGVCEL